MLRHQRGDLTPRAIEVLEHVGQPGLALAIRGRRGDHSKGRRPVLHREAEPLVQLLIRVVRGDELRGLEPRDVPRLRRARPRHRMRGRRLRHRRVRDEGRPVVAQRRVDLIREHPPAVAARRPRRSPRALPTDDRSVGLCGLQSTSVRAPAANASSMRCRSCCQRPRPRPRDLDHRMPDRRQVCQERHICRSRHDHRRASGCILLHRDPERGHHIRHRMHALRVDRPVVFASHPSAVASPAPRPAAGERYPRFSSSTARCSAAAISGATPKSISATHAPIRPGVQTPLPALRPVEEQAGAFVERMRGGVCGHGRGFAPAQPTASVQDRRGARISGTGNSIHSGVRPIYGRPAAVALRVSVRDDGRGIPRRPHGSRTPLVNVP